MSPIKFLAYYLPQYHPIPENDEWWGKGFTEWTNVAKAKPLFKGHYQPILPGELGFYDLRVPEVREAQAQLAKDYGIDGFIYYHYWFGGGKQLLQKPAEEVLANCKPNFPFCFCWANETWKGIWHGVNNPTVFVEQTYPGTQDIEQHFNYLLPFFKDARYIRVNDMPMLHIYKPEEIPECAVYLAIWQSLAKKAGLHGIFFVGTHVSSATQLKPNELGLNVVVGIDVFSKIRYKPPFSFKKGTSLYRVEKKIKKVLQLTDDFDKRRVPQIWDYSKAVKQLQLNFEENSKVLPCVFPNWDNSARSGKKSLIFKNANPNIWGSYLEKVVRNFTTKNQQHPFIIIKSWNEWAEGNYLEPDAKYGRAWLEQVKRVKDNFSAS